MKCNLSVLTYSCARVMLLAFNLFCILLALVTLGYVIVDANILRQYGENQATGSIVGDIIVGIASFILICIAIFGCVGVLRSNIKFLYLYIGFLMIIVLLELLLGIWIALQRYGLQFRLTEMMRENFFKNVTIDEQEEHNKQWDVMQNTYECCGLNSPEDYIAIGQKISLSCCQRAYRARTVQAQQRMYATCIEVGSYFKNGCEDELMSLIQEQSEGLLGVAVFAFWCEAIGMLLALVMINHIKNSVQVYKHTVKY
ncbi:hypothetical protein K1T71_003702 [Dendrolimus kikuchii]|uniref:Uncharacterized protein n=1 Tax=Dendrolimus kikuchii TaxID=765133 RepID=A0ACC1D9P2_9NEOP|nr:hypothetical protein K1T71_003702 [Dendrolimus kikuchii]